MQCMSNIFGSIASTVVGHKKSGKNLQILRPIFRSFWSQWLACFGWMASQTQMCLTGICQGTILDTRQKLQFLQILHNSRAQLTEGNFYNCKMIGTIYYFWYGSNDIGTCPGVVSSSYLRDGSTFGWELAILPWSWPVSVCPQLIIKLSQLPKKPDVRLDLSGLPHERKCLRGRHLFLFHQICHHDGSGPEIYWKKAHNSPI